MLCGFYMLYRVQWSGDLAATSDDGGLDSDDDSGDDRRLLRRCLISDSATTSRFEGFVTDDQFLEATVWSKSLLPSTGVLQLGFTSATYINPTLLLPSTKCPFGDHIQDNRRSRRARHS
uniref:Uncharacterized protein n=1 Tax=Helianthus annuus TaxID=4232 RepID=A0A251SK25_HELAN